MEPIKVTLSVLFFTQFFAPAFGRGIFPNAVVNTVNNSPYVFEAQFVSDSVYFGPGTRTIYTASFYKVTKIFKGDLQCGNVEIVCAGGEIGGIGTEVFDQPSLYGSGIVMARPTSNPTLDAPKENPVALDGEMVGYGKNGRGPEFEFWSKPILSNQAVIDTVAKAVGHGYSRCEIDTEPIKPPSVQNQSSINPVFDHSATNYVDLYPDSATGTICIAVPLSVKSKIYLLVYNYSGKIVIQKNDALAANLQKLDISALKPGTYLGHAYYKSTIYSFKFVKH